MSARPGFQLPDTRGRHMRGKKANRLWSAGKAYLLAPADNGCKFEALIHQLGLAGRPDEWPESEKLQKFARKYRNHHYVPEYLLKTWGIEVRLSGGL